MSDLLQSHALLSERERRALSGLEYLQGIFAGKYPQAPMALTLDYKLVMVEPGRVIFVGTPSDRFYSRNGQVHPGYAATLLESCMSAAIHSNLASDQAYRTIDLMSSFVQAMTAETGPVRADGKVLSFGPSLATAEGRVTDQRGTLLAHGLATFAVHAH